MNPNHRHQSDTYRVRVKETLSPHVADWLGDITLIPQENGETILIGVFTDQPALRGFLDQLWNLNINVICVERIENES